MHRDENGNIREVGSGKIVKDSAIDTAHLSNLAVDFTIDGMCVSKDYLKKYFDWVKDDYKDKHIHGDLRNSGGYCTKGKMK